GPDASSCAPSVSAPVRTAPPRVHGRMPSSARRTAPGPCARLQAVRERWSSMQPARSARHAGPARRRRSARTVGRLVLLAITLLTLALGLSPLGLGLASADDEGGETDGTPRYHRPAPGFTSPGGESGNEVTPDSDPPTGSPI